MTDKEIVSWLRELTPDSTEQKEKIKKAINIFLTEVKLTSADYYLNDLAYDEIYMKNPSDMYKRYEKYCEENDLKCESVNMFSRTVRKIFHLKAKPINNFGETLRVYLEE